MRTNRVLSLCSGLAVFLALSWCVAGCNFFEMPSDTDPDSFREAMRAWVIELSTYARQSRPGFLIVAQNGEELLTHGRTSQAPLALDFIAALDGLGREDLFYGYDTDNEPTPAEASEWMLGYLTLAERERLEVLVTDYCWLPDHTAASHAANDKHGFASYAAPSRELDRLPDAPSMPHRANDEAVYSLSDVRNFLYLLNASQFPSRAAYLEALQDTSYDLLILDLEFDGTPLSASDVASLQIKPSGESRLVLCYLSIGEAEDYRDYWQSSWGSNPPVWLLDENPNWPGNYTVAYWHTDWQTLIRHQMDAILGAGFDGVYLDRVDVYEAFEATE